MNNRVTSEELRERNQRVKDTLCCPHCNEKLEKWEVPETPFVEWASEFHYICFNDECPYFNEGWSVMAAQNNPCSYRFMYDPSSGGCHSIPVPTKDALRENIVQTTQATND